jgi:ABC-type transporter Mla maintaining outer membrane lipid asymmetry ATPase subunit MlaF
MHVVGGSGHGKTQLLQSLILRDLKKLSDGKGSLVVID